MIAESLTFIYFIQAEAKFDLDLAKQALDWIQAVTGVDLLAKTRDGSVKDHVDFADCLKDGVALCTLINALQPGSVKKVNTMSAPFKQRENLEQFLAACQTYGLKSHDLFQVSDLYERKNLYTVVNCLHALGGLVSHLPTKSLVILRTSEFINWRTLSLFF